MKKMNKALSLVLAGSMVVSMLATGAFAADAPTYSDVPASAAYSEAVEYLAAEKIMDGIGDGKFGPQDTVTRAMAVTVLGRMTKAEQVETKDFTDIVPNSWYSGYVGWAVENNIVQGDGKGHFMPNRMVTSEEMNLILSRYAKLIGVEASFYDTGAKTVTRADLAQRLYTFYQEDVGEGDTPMGEAPNIQYVDRVVYVDRPVSGETVTVVIFVNKDGYYVDAAGAYVNPENGETVTEPIQVPNWDPEKPVDGGKLPITAVDEKMMPAVAHLTGEGQYGFGSGYLLGYRDNGVYSFLNIKYGNAERFKHPTPNTSYGSASTPSFCMNPGPVAPQQVTKTEAVKGFGNAAILTPSDSDMYASETNCLNLNVWTTDIASEGHTPEKKPVLVFMHGGGYTEGSSIEQKNYRGEYFTRYTDVVFVSVNARLNTLGYADLSALGGDPNLAISDMVLALEWVQDNIEQFGGDPSNVTIMGQSGGGGKVSALASSPKAYNEKLFSKVVNASGSSASASSPSSTASSARSVANRVRQSDRFVDWLRTVYNGQTVETEGSTSTQNVRVTLESASEGSATYKLPSEVDDREVNWANIYVNFGGFLMPVQASDIGEDGTLTNDPNLVNNPIFERVYELDEEGSPALDEEGNVVYEDMPLELIVEGTPAGPANKFPDDVNLDNVRVIYYGYTMSVNAGDIDRENRTWLGDSNFNSNFYLVEIKTVTTEGGEFTISNDCTWNELRAFAASASDADVFTFLQQVNYDYLSEYGLSTSTFTADNVYFSSEGSFGNNTPSRNYTYYYGSCWGEMSMASSDGGVMNSRPSAFLSNIDLDAWARNYCQNRVGSYEEIVAEFNKVWPNHVLYDLQAAGTGSFGGQYNLARNLQGDNKVYTYFNAYDFPMFGGLTVVHTQDLGLMFHSLEALPYQIHGDEENAYKVADAAATALADFCRTGVPTVNGEPLPANTGNASENYTTIFDVESRIVQSGFNSEMVRLLQRQG